jgi:transposase
MTDSLVELSYHTKFTKGINIMDQLNSTTFTPDRQRGPHLKFEDRCSIRIFNKLGYSLRKTAETIGCSASTVLNELRRGVGKRNGTRGRNPEYSAKRGQQNYEINRSRCHKPHKLDSNSEFVKWLAKQIKTRKWSLDACVGYARKHELFAADKIPCTKTLYSELWAGNLPITPFDVPEALRRTTKHIKLVRISAFLDPV